mmetsp:Transcript_14095/g.42642  ORF Transcript_14095/g.42642 Transcript_14095/m.42642 type:complete len:167 (+) Transcript_14095:80-580(+)
MSQQQQGPQQVDIGKLSLEQLNSLKQEHESTIQDLSGKLEAMRNSEARLRESRKALNILHDEPEGQPMLVPLTQSLYVPGEVLEPDKILVDVGTGYYLEKTADGARDLVDRRLDTVTKLAANVVTVLEQKQSNLQTLVMMMQYKMQQIQNRKDQLDSARADGTAAS